mmetsp:Transcript_25641/g.22659  ORF Transcript_25641/g.22659 Transcript_25641/m.22659 type:complete len:125 (+) Transcript_25641:2644-3018(+)
MTEKSNFMMKFRISSYKRIDYVIKKIFGGNFDVKTRIFGSCATGLALENSDVDVAIGGIEVYDKSDLGANLIKINNCLKNYGWIVSHKPIITAHVPVLKLVINPLVKFNTAKEDCKISYFANDT